MQKNLIIAILLAVLLTGCRRADDIFLEDMDTASSESDILSESEGELYAGAADSPGGGDALGTKESLSEGSGAAESIREGAGDDEDTGTVFVYVCGAVNEPGVYELFSDGRIDDAVKAAGGFSEVADTSYVNLAARLTDGVKLYIPTTEETKDADAGTSIPSYEGGTCADSGSALEGDIKALSGSKGSLININSASKEELKTLNGIGDATAEKIIKYREEHGSFSAIEDIMKVSGIKDKLFSKIKDYITV